MKPDPDKGFSGTFQVPDTRSGALLGRFFFMKRYGAMWRQYAPVLLAGFSCGMGLTGMFAMGGTLILKSLGRLAY